MNSAANTLTALSDLSVIALTGEDATSFLQSQLTQDIAAIQPEQAMLSGYCTARGRLFASMIVLQRSADPSEGWLLLCKADLASQFAQRLRMFVLRSKVNIELTDHVVTGVHTDPDASATAHPPYTVVRRDDHLWISAPQPKDSSRVRWWLLTPRAQQTAADNNLSLWHANDIAAGLPWVQAATMETFIPQTVNMDLIDGVSFSKGCYPGQEVVARSHYRGTIKRRMAYAVGSVTQEYTDDLAGQDTFDTEQPDQPCGRVINATVVDGVLHVLMEVQLSDLKKGDFRIGSGDGPAVQIRDLPYSILPDATE